jgi:GNAT superfamily N-acetyltransferase
MKTTQLNHNNKRDVRDFLAVPLVVYKDIPQWVPPLAGDARLVLNRNRFPFYQHSDAAFFIARQNGTPVGRICVMDNRRFNDFRGENTAFFYLFETVDDAGVADALFAAASQWARSRGLDSILGPHGFTPMDGNGLLVDGFEYRPAFGQPYNPAYYVRHVERQGFRLNRETVSGYLSADTVFDERIHELAERVKKRRGLHVARYRTRKDLRALLLHLKDLYNGSLGSEGTNVPLTDEEINSLGEQLLWIADPSLVKVVMKEDEPVGFVLAYPDISAAIQKVRGKLLPFGVIPALLEKKRTDWLNFNGAGLIEKYRGLGGTAILFSEMYKSATESGQFNHAEVVQIRTENENMLREMHNFGLDFYKTHRVYEMSL